MFWSVGWPLLWAGGFFCNLYILYGGLGIGKLQFLIKKKFKFFSAVIFFQFLVITALDPDPYWPQSGSSGSRSGSGSVTVKKRIRIRNPVFFKSKIAIYLSLGLDKETSKLQEKPSALKTQHRALQKMKLINFFLFLWIRIRIANPHTYTDSQHSQTIVFVPFFGPKACAIPCFNLGLYLRWTILLVLVAVAGRTMWIFPKSSGF